MSLGRSTSNEKLPSENCRRAFFFIVAFTVIIFLAVYISRCNPADQSNQTAPLPDTTSLRDKDADPVKCSVGSFILQGMESCHPWLTCENIRSDLFVHSHLLGAGAVKKVYLGLWNGHRVAASSLINDNMLEDFLHGIDMLKLYNSDGHHNNKIVQLVGWCVDEEEPIVVTEFHPLGTSDKILSILNSRLGDYNYLPLVFQFCIDFVEILHTLHSYNNETRVFCDTNYPEKTLSQILVSNNLSLVLNDVDALALVNKEAGTLIKCGHRELDGDFVAPEQLWPFEDQPFQDDIMLGYDEKVDIWKIPDVCNSLLDQVKGSASVKLHLFNIHSKCRNDLPQDRPSAAEVLQEYYKVKVKLKL